MTTRTAFAPIAYLADADAEPGRMLEHEESERLRSKGLEQRSDSSGSRAAAASSKRAGCARRIPRRCTSWRTSSACRPSASARSKRRR